MQSKATYFFAVLLFPLFFSCKNEVTDSDSKTPVETEVNISEEKDVVEKRAKVISSSVMARAMTTPELSNFVSSLISAGLVDPLNNGDETYTVLAPSNEAFDAIDPKMKASMFNLANVGALKQVLTQHIVIGAVDSISLVNNIRNNNGNYTINTMAGTQLSASRDGMDIIFTDANGKKAKLIKSDIKAENGVLHLIDAVLGQ